MDFFEILCSPDNYRYYIQFIMNSKKFFFYELIGFGESDILQIKWTPVIATAYPFKTEEQVEEFKSDYISPRKVSIIRLSAQNMH